MKIVYCVSGQHCFGGTEVVTVVKAEALANVDGVSVWVLNSEAADTMAFSSSGKVRLVDLGVRYNEVSGRFPFNLLAIFYRKLRHGKALKATLNRIRPDIVISTGLEKSFLPFIRGPWKTIREIHFPKNRRQRAGKGNPVLRLFSKMGDWFEYDVVCKKYDRVIVLTREDLIENWKDSTNVCAIPNPVRFQPITPSPLNKKRVLAAGRLSYEKNFSSLIRAFSLVSKRFPEWCLDIYGEGTESSSLRAEINDLGLSDCICLKGNTKDLEKELLSSSIFVASSKYEGFSLVLVEAMACGLPVVSYSCPYGPEEIVHDEENGFLVPVDDENTLAERICRLITDESLRSRMGASAFERARAYSLERITQTWMSLFNDLLLEQSPGNQRRPWEN